MASFKVLRFLKLDFFKIIAICLGLTLMGCSGGGSCSECNNGSNTRLPSFSLTAPSEYPAGIATTVYLTMYNTSSVNAEDITYHVESNTTNAQIKIYPDGAGNGCNNIAAYESCVFTAAIESGSNPGSFTILATGTDSASALNKANIKKSNFNATVAVSIGLVSIPGNIYPLYLLPSNQTLNLESNGINVLFSVLIESKTLAPISLMNADGTPISPAPVLLNPIPDGGVYESGLVVTFSVNYPANPSALDESLVAFSSTCTSNTCSNPAFVNFIESGIGILTLAPSNVTLSESYTSQIYTLTNTGESVITITALPTVTSPLNLVNNCGDVPFVLSPAPSSASSCTFTIVYTPVTNYGLETLVINYDNGIGGSESTALSITYAPNPPLFTWMSGSNALNQPAVYGSKGVPNPGNIPGARYASAGWANDSGNLWLFGGYGGGGFLNDFWQYNINSDQWTWIGGSESINTPGVYGTMDVESTTNMPGSRYLAATWVDQTGNFWLFGGYGYNYQNYRNVLNDLWKYDINTHQWVWMSGTMNLNSPGVYGEKNVESAGNVPGARLSAVSWTDALGNLWLFGGSIPGSSIEYNDLWKYNINSGYWTWISGSSSANQNGSYGTKGIESSDNVPGARDSSNTWIDAAGNLWLFGGNGYSSTSFFADSLNDLWKYDVNSGNWVWMSGSKDLNQLGVYGILQVPSSSNVPGARYKAASWQDNYGNFWIFGGDASQSNASVSLNDLWQYNLKTGIWTWVAGANLINQAGSYGTIGVGSISNIPGARYSEVSWQESGNLWLFSGLGFPALSVESGYLNDLWRINLVH